MRFMRNLIEGSQGVSYTSEVISGCNRQTARATERVKSAQPLNQIQHKDSFAANACDSDQTAIIQSGRR